MNALAQQLTAGIKLQSALALARDLQQERPSAGSGQAPDPAVFTRMVDGHGKQVVTHDIAVKNIRRLVAEAQEQYPVTCRYLARWLELTTATG